MTSPSPSRPPASGPDPAPAPSGTYRSWQRLRSTAPGRAAFSMGMRLRVPYFATVRPTVRVMEPGRCEVTAPKWWPVHNHLGTFHAIAVCNLAETAMGMLCEATVPASHRWIPQAMEVRYPAKATTGLRAVATLDTVPDFGAAPDGFTLPVPITVYDTARTVVLEATITVWVTPRR